MRVDIRIDGCIMRQVEAESCNRARADYIRLRRKAFNTREKIKRVTATETPGRFRQLLPDRIEP